MNVKAFQISMSLLLVSLVSGCSSGPPTYSVKYMAEPDGATIYCDGVSYGFAPATVKWQYSQAALDTGELRVGKCESVWVSGARASYDTTHNIRAMPYGAEQKTFRFRDDRYHIDAEYALNRESLLNQKKNAKKSTICHNVYGTIICN